MSKSMNDQLNDAIDQIAQLKAQNDHMRQTLVTAVATMAQGVSAARPMGAPRKWEEVKVMLNKAIYRVDHRNQ